jgi:RNA polymerase sigma-70 factor (ECF subfamily)
MRELVLIQPGRTLEGASAREAERARTDREFEARLAECGPLAFRVAQGVLRNAADAEEVAQEALLRAYRNFERMREPARFRGWLVRITFRMALDRWRSVRRREKRETEWMQPEQRGTPPTPEEVAVSQEFQWRLERAMDEMPEKSRIVLLLAAIEGYTLEEVAGMLGIPIGTVKSRLFLARKQLAEKLQ